MFVRRSVCVCLVSFDVHLSRLFSSNHSQAGVYALRENSHSRDDVAYVIMLKCVIYLTTKFYNYVIKLYDVRNINIA